MQPKGGFLKGGATATEDSIRRNNHNGQKSLLPSFTIAAAFPFKGFRGFSR